MSEPLPQFLVDYVLKQDQKRADAISAVWSEFTEREQGLIKDAAVMGYVQGMMQARAGLDWPGDWVAVPTVIGACLAHAAMYPTITGWTPAEDES